ncbi:MAG: hypothetical protein KAW92_09610 [Candidatus Cloacimonetes bacterium]|nr:hypothetical protein [Candidatus Cloacimonadota bacterium]
MKWYEDKMYWVMCEKAEEIQKKFDFLSNMDYRDSYVCKKHKCLIRLSDHYYCPEINGNVCIYPKNLTWLPTQEELQEMIDWKQLYSFEIIPEIGGNKFLGRIWDSEGERVYDVWCNSINQLWLAFVMYLNYHKVWSSQSGGRWIKEEKCQNYLTEVKKKSSKKL